MYCKDEAVKKLDMELFSFEKRKREKLDAAARSDALDWILRISDDPEAEAQCAEWRAAAPEHEAAWDEALEVWNRSGNLGSLDRDDWRQEIESLSVQASAITRKSWGFAIAATIVAALCLGWLLTLPGIQYSTGVAQTQQIALGDGSQLTLGADSKVELRFEEDERNVVLNDGQAYFEVAKDRSRPFVVRAGNAEVRVTGTKFDVRRTDADVTVSVSEGRVEVRRVSFLPFGGSDSELRVLTAGLQSTLAEGTGNFEEPRAAIIPAGEWKQGRFFYHDAALSQIIWDAGRYSSVPLRIDDPTVAAMKVTTSFQVEEIDQFLVNLTAILPIVQSHEPDGAIVLEARR